MTEETSPAIEAMDKTEDIGKPKRVRKPAAKKAAAPKKEKKAPAKKAPKAKPAKKEKKAPVKKAEGARGRTSQFAGGKIFKLVPKNPRREGTKGHTSFSLITSGMKYEKFTELGGRNEDLAFDVKKGYVEVRFN